VSPKLSRHRRSPRTKGSPCSEMRISSAHDCRASSPGPTAAVGPRTIPQARTARA